MFTFLMVALFLCFSVWSVLLICKAAWRLATVGAAVLLILAVPVMIGYLQLAGGLMLMVPLGMSSIALGILKA